MIKKPCQVIVMLVSLLISSASFANVDSDLNNFFNGVGYQSNVTSPGAYHDQAAGYYTGGSLFLRNQVRNYQLVSVQLPSFSGGCSGIDAYLGSFSVINSSQIKSMMQNIMSAGGAYAFDLALTTTVPQIKSVKDYIQKYVNDINSHNINSCNMGEDLVGGLWPKTQASQQQICRDVGSQSGVFADYAAARQGCGVGGQFNQSMDSPKNNRKAEVVVNKNLVWDALQKNGLTASEPQLAELLMSLSGSIIIKTEDKATQKTTLMSMAHSQDIIKALLYGGQAHLYVCSDTERCLNPSIQTITVTKQHGLASQVVNLIRELNTAVATDSGSLSPAMQGFLEMTPVPILKYITNSLSLGKAINPSEFSDIISVSLLNQYLSENIQLVQTALSQEDTPMSPKMAEQINQAQQLVATRLANSYRQLANINVLVNNMHSTEKELTSRLVNEAMAGQEAK